MFREGRGVPKDLQEAARLILESAEGGHPGAMADIGEMYWAGSGGMLRSRIQSCTPCCEGMRPVIRLARAGEQTGEVQKKLSKRTPLAARRSMLGVRISGFP